MECRAGCAACCIYVSISSPIPGMPEGKPFGVRCIQLSEDNQCMIFGRPERPKVCGSLQASAEMCGNSTRHANAYLSLLEAATKPGNEAGNGK